MSWVPAGDPDFGYGVGMIRTSDGGWNWTYDELDIQGNAYDIDFRNDSEVWAPLGPRRKLIYSTDAGVTWAPVVPPDDAAIYDMTFPDTLHGFAVGKEGVVLKYIPPVMPGVPETGPPQFAFRLDQNHPNPAASSTAIKITVPPSLAGQNNDSRSPGGSLSLKVYNVYGKEVVSYINAPLPPGDHVVDINTATLPAGIYLYTLERMVDGHAERVAEQRCMVVIR
jgi:hypothetical protein